MARRKQQPNALVSAATRIRLAEPKVAQGQAAKRQVWQTEAWAYFDEVPELKEAVRYRGNQLAKLRLFVAAANPDDAKGEPVPATDEASGVPPAVAAAAQAELDRLHGEYGGHGEILRETDMNLNVAGELYLVCRGEHTRTENIRGVDQTVTVAEDWQVRSIAEVEVTEGRYKVKESPADMKGYVLDPDKGDDIIRIWTKHPQWSAVADSPMRGLLGECRTLQVLSQQVLAQAMRSVSAGFLTVPNELSFGPADPTGPDGDGEGEVDPLNQALNDVLVRPIDNPSDPSTVQPGVLRGAAEFLKPDVLRRISFYDPALDTVLEQKIEARVQRIARGLNLPVEKIMGHQSTTFANAEQVSEDEFNDYLRPSADAIVDSLTYAYLVPQLAANETVGPEWADGRLFVWYDASELIAQPDKEKNADRGLELGAISTAAWRGAKGYGADDAPDVLELLTRAGLRRGILTADLTLALLELMEGAPSIEVESSADAPSDDAAPADGGEPDVDATSQVLQQLIQSLNPEARTRGARRAPGAKVIEASATLVAAARPDYGRMLTEVDRDLRTRLVVAANDAMTRALERAANVLRNKAKADLRQVPNRLAFAHLGPTRVTALLAGADPLAGAWDNLEDLFMAWGAGAQAQALDVAGQVAAGFTVSERTALQLRQADDLAEAWGWLRGAMAGLADDVLFDPDPATEILDVLGEFDPTTKVPAGMLRQAIARAGGATGLSTSEGGAWVTLTDGGTRPAGGIGTGELLRGAMRDAGASVEGYTWVYGPAFRKTPFEPHRALDGVTFVAFDDDVLASDGTFGSPFWFPGDHGGCCDDFVPIILPASEVES